MDELITLRKAKGIFQRKIVFRSDEERGGDRSGQAEQSRHRSDCGCNPGRMPNKSRLQIPLYDPHPNPLLILSSSNSFMARHPHLSTQF